MNTALYLHVLRVNDQYEFRASPGEYHALIARIRAQFGQGCRITTRTERVTTRGKWAETGTVTDQPQPIGQIISKILKGAEAAQQRRK